MILNQKENKTRLESTLSSKNSLSLYLSSLNLISESDMAEKPRSRTEITPNEPEQASQPAIKYATNLNQLAAEGKFDNVIGREEEIKDITPPQGWRLSPYSDGILTQELAKK